VSDFEKQLTILFRVNLVLISLSAVNCQEDETAEGQKSVGQGLGVLSGIPKQLQGLSRESGKGFTVPGQKEVSG